ncbi:MAG: serine hydrolase [Syntrophobacteraceae bacterium]|jgi:CubicO group peptidase (beta-lactamase class C family)
MRTSTKRILSALGVVIALCTVVFGFYLWKAALVVSGFKAKCLCSDVFVSRRDPATVLTEDLEPVGALYPLRFDDAKIDYTRRTVTASFWGFAERKAIFRDGLGCSLVIGTTEDKLRSETIPVSTRDTHGDGNGIWPDGEMADTEKLPPAVDGKKLNEALEWAFRESDPDHLRRTRAVVVVYDGKIVAERYAAGYNADTPLPGWSMTKSVFAALTGILADEGKISLKSNGLLPQWRDGQDPRRAITLENLLRMSSGLAFHEAYSSPLTDVVVMLFGTGDMASFASDKPLAAAPAAKWHYSTGNTIILSKLIRNTFGNAQAEYLEFPRRALFDRIGMKSAVVEPDASGTLVASSFMFATARDWARFGLLCLRDGMWGKERILPEGWIKYCTTPAPVCIHKEYGAGFWLYVPREFRSGKAPCVDISCDTYHAVGYDGQFVTIIPSRNLVIVRLGLTHTYETWVWDQEELIKRVSDAVRSEQ